MAQSANALTETQATMLPKLVVSATRGTKNVLDVPMTVSVISAEELEKRVVRDIQDLVRYEPGVSVDRTTSMTNPWGQLNSFRIRGASGNRVRMIVDGSRVQEQIIDGSRNFVDPANMKSIEIVRGPNSVLWGSDALGGTVVFRTRDPSDLLEGQNKPWALEVKSSFDSLDNSFRKQVTAAYDFGDVQVLGSFGHRSANEARLSNAQADGGFYGCPRSAVLACNLFNPLDVNAINGLAKVVWTPNADHKITLTAEGYDDFSRVNQIYDTSTSAIVSGSPTLTTYRNTSYQRDLNMRRSRFAIEHEWVVRADWLDSVKWQLSYSPQQRVENSRQVRTYSNRTETMERLRDSTEQFYEANLQMISHFDLGATYHTLTYGFDGDISLGHYAGTTKTLNSLTGKTTTLINEGFAYPDTTTIRADAFIQDEIKLLDERLTITPGVRLSSYRLDPTGDTDFPVNPTVAPRVLDALNFTKKLGATYKLDESYSLYASYGEGFKLPTAQQLFVTSGTMVVPNPELKPESVWSVEGGLRGEFDKGYFSLGGFYGKYTDFIASLQDAPGNPGKYTSLNMSTVELWGIEASAEFEFYENLFLNGSLTWQRGTQIASPGAATTPYDGATPLTAVIGLRYEIPEHALELEVLGTFAAGPTERASATAFKPDGYAVFDAFAKWKPAENVEIDFGVQNIFDTRYFPNTLTNYSTNPTAAVRAQNPLELQVAPGRTFKVGAKVTF